MTNLATLLTASASAHGDRIAVRHETTALTYARLDDLSARTAALLQTRGVRPGDRVAVIMPNVPHFPVAYYGILRAGAVVVPLNPLLKAREIAFALRDCGARTVLTSPMSAAEAAAAAADTEADCLVVEPAGFDALLDAAVPLPGVAEAKDSDLAVILYTSGTTGTPKGAELTHRNLLGNAATAVQTLFHIRPDDVLFGGLPLFHAFGQTCALNTAVAAGATLTLLTRFDPAAALETIRRDAVTVLLGVPTMYAALLHAELPEGFDAPACAWPSPAARRYRSRCCTASRSASASTCWRATACPRRLRWPPSTRRTARASPVRSACPSAASSCGWSGRTGRRPGPARSPRSRSAART